MKKLIVPLWGLLVCVAALGQVRDASDNTCRQGLFTSESDSFKVGVVKKVKDRAGRAYFYDDMADDCPESSSCRTKNYVVTGQTVITNRQRGDFVCAWYTPKKGWSTVGWLKVSDLDFPVSRVKVSDKTWTGEWRYAQNSISITPNKLAGFLNVSGTAVWQGLGDNIHIGELDGAFPYEDGVLKYSDGDSQYDCKATLRLVDVFLVVTDNMNCGGANVTFSGIYRRKRPSPRK
jgi:hypothetical protein